MLEILYRIYQVATEEERKKNLSQDLAFGLYSSTSKAENNELVMDCLICDNREQFKSIIKSEYGDNISFRYSKTLKTGQLYCIIIGEHCYDTEKYFNKVSYKCDYCGGEVSTYIKNHISINNSTIKYELSNITDYSKKKFCCNKCLSQYIEQEKQKLRMENEDYVDNEWITRDSFTNENLSGYIYKITKKSTGEFYVGQTVYVPIFRWGQHLKTNRFDIKNILDYQFEVIELVPKNENLLEREKFWIQKLYKEHPEKSLNIMQTMSLRKEDINYGFGEK